MCRSVRIWVSSLLRILFYFFFFLSFHFITIHYLIFWNSKIGIFIWISYSKDKIKINKGKSIFLGVKHLSSIWHSHGHVHGHGHVFFSFVKTYDYCKNDDFKFSWEFDFLHKMKIYILSLIIRRMDKVLYQFINSTHHKCVNRKTSCYEWFSFTFLHLLKIISGESGHWFVVVL